MKLSQLMDPCPADFSDIEIKGLETRAQNIQPGFIFFAVKGYAADGHDYIDTALEKGAALVIAEKNPDNHPKIMVVDNSRRAVADMAAAYFGHPSRQMTLVGITGTNGKTTITYLLESIFARAGHSCGVMGTINIRYPGHCADAPTTTPDALAIQKTLAEMKKAGVTHVVMEVSSHGLAMHRVDGCDFNAAVFTNLSQDHLDFHGSMDEYYHCKKSLFTHHLSLGSAQGTAVINMDGNHGKELADELAALSCPMVRVSHTQETDLSATQVEDKITGLSATFKRPGELHPFCSGLTGRFNLENILCAAGAASALGFNLEQIARGIEACPVIPGRLERVANTINRHLFVDYAHTPDALESILKTLVKRAPKRVISVFGCGGNRDKTKRPPMGKAACCYSDIAIVTSDNPRNETPDAIIQDILPGMESTNVPRLTPEQAKKQTGTKGYLVEVDRKKALDLAVAISRPGDIIVAAGKGHEPYQITNAGTIHFDDREELDRAAREFAQGFTPIPWRREDMETALGVTATSTGDIPGDIRFSTIGTDSRTLETDQVFLALEGEKFDGHDFIPALIEKGIKAFVVKEGYIETARDLPRGLIFLETPNTLTALGDLGRYQRLRAGVKILAITGSNGKTSTRKMAQAIFGKAFETLATRGNLNNEIGVPLTLLRLSAAHEWAVIEMGMNHAGEMGRLSSIVLPDLALVTNTAAAHLEGLKTAENVAQAKGEIFEHSRPQAKALIFRDDPRYDILEACARSNEKINEIIGFGQGDQAHVKAKNITSQNGWTHFTLQSPEGPLACALNSNAQFMVNNALGAAAAARMAGIKGEDIQAGLQDFTPVAGRMAVSTLANGAHLMDDTYNANPHSMGAGLETLAQSAKATSGRSIAVLGDMLELGENTDALHADMGKKAAGLNLDFLFLHGPHMEMAYTAALNQGMDLEQLFHGSKEDIAQKLLSLMAKEDWILIKGSRTMAMETIIQTLEKELTREMPNGNSL